MEEISHPAKNKYISHPFKCKSEMENFILCISSVLENAQWNIYEGNVCVGEAGEISRRSALEISWTLLEITEDPHKNSYFKVRKVMIKTLRKLR